MYIYIASFIAGLLAALASYKLNSHALAVLGDVAVTYGAPIIEECLKTGFALFLGGSIIVSHITFGIVEALYDYNKNRGLLARLAAGAGFLSHSIFGFTTVFFTQVFNTPIMGILLTLAIHMAWNYLMIHVKIKNH